MTASGSADEVIGDDPIAIVGATSQMAKDFILSRGPSASFALYARDPAKVEAFLAAESLPRHWARGELSDLRDDAAHGSRFAGIVNFVGVGDPARASALGGGIYDATSAADAIARAALAYQAARPYVFVSSGAVYGHAFHQPAQHDSAASFQINPIGPESYYGIAKLHAEAIHRSCTGQTIIDLRIFNYISRRQDIASRFLVIDMVRCIIANEIFLTSEEEITRDYLNPEGFAALLHVCLSAPAGTNQAVDAYSTSPITKREMLDFMATDFGLRYRITHPDGAVSATGDKPHYYSTSFEAAKLGYRPRLSSADAIRAEVASMLAAHA